MKKFKILLCILAYAILIPIFDMNADQKDIHSEIYVLMHRPTHSILTSRDPDLQFSPASLTKIMTTWVALELLEEDQLNDTYTLPYEVFYDLVVLDASVAGFSEQEDVKIIDILYGIMLPSSADASRAIAFYLKGSEEAFVDVMNEKVRELGLENTHFENTSGLDQANHLSTANDLAIILDNALKNPLFKEIFEARSYQTSHTNYTEGHTWTDKNLEFADNQGAGLYLNGTKSGYTELAGAALASSATVNGDDYLLITARAPYSAYEFFNVQDAFYFYSNVSGFDKKDHTVTTSSQDTFKPIHPRKPANSPAIFLGTAFFGFILYIIYRIHIIRKKRRLAHARQRRYQRMQR